MPPVAGEDMAGGASDWNRSAVKAGEGGRDLTSWALGVSDCST